MSIQHVGFIIIEDDTALIRLPCRILCEDEDNLHEKDQIHVMVTA